MCVRHIWQGFRFAVQKSFLARPRPAAMIADLPISFEILGSATPTASRLLLAGACGAGHRRPGGDWSLETVVQMKVLNRFLFDFCLLVVRH